MSDFHPSKLPRGLWWLNLGWFVAEMVVMSVLIAFLLIAAVSPPRPIGREDGHGFWRALLIGNAIEIRSAGADRVIWVWGRHGPRFGTASREEVSANYSKAVSEYIDDQVRDSEWGGEDGAENLRVLTRQTFGNDIAAWQRWWRAAGSSFQPDTDGVERLVLFRGSRGKMRWFHGGFFEMRESAELSYANRLKWAGWERAVVPTALFALAFTLIGSPIVRGRVTRRLAKSKALS